MTDDPFANQGYGFPAQRDEVDDFLAGVKRTAAKFPVIGHSYTGIVLSKKMEHENDYDEPDKKKYWRDRSMKALSESEVLPTDKPVRQAAVEIQTAVRGTFDRSGSPESVENDQGVRWLFVKSHLQKAIKAAIQASGAPTLEIGGKLTVTYSGNGRQNNPKYNPPKVFTAEYVPASKVDPDDPLLKLIADESDEPEDPFSA